ncbi:MAG TPA: PAS domain S-box protein [Ideonella sp.]|uniref:PAS domain S-box protein n=1 Tax=Ideonella sp. TaxID=1929293 RepID=UPI002BCA1528|nr:PAS domain S-box protein [Ideonella sp.]HSI51953.1 PAS domain S-box protein [Ideonella sp.]
MARRPARLTPPAASHLRAISRWRALAGAGTSGLLLALAAMSLWQLYPGEWPAPLRWGLGALIGVAGGVWLSVRLQRSRAVAQPEVLPVAAPAAAASPVRDPLAAGLLAMTADAVLTLDDQGRLLGLVEQDGRQRLAALGALTGQPLWALPGARLSPRDLPALQRALKEGRPWRDLDWHWQAPDGHAWHFALSGLPRHGSGGRLLGFGAVLRDLRGEQRFQALFAELPQPLLLHRGARLLDANPAALQLLGVAQREALLARDLLESFAPGDSRAQVARQFEAARRQPAGASPLIGRFLLDAAGGVPQPVQVRSQVLDGGGAGEAPATLSLLLPEDIASHGSSGRTHALMSHLVDTSPDAITLTELASSRYVMVNASFERLTGYRAADVVGRSALEVGIWALPSQRGELLEALRRQPTVLDMPVALKARNGRRLEVLLSAARFSVEQVDYLVVTLRDVTQVEQTRLEYQAILDNALIGIAFARDEHFVMANPRFEAMLGWPPGTLVGQHAAVIWPTRADHLEAQRRFDPRLTAGEPIELEHLLKRRDGSVFLCRLMAKAINPHKPGPRGNLWLAEDVTERRQVEQQLAKARDEAQAANRAKSDFLANLSHEIRTPLNALLGLARLARQPEVGERRRQDYIEQISESAETLSAIISDILDLSKIEAGKMHLEHMPFSLQALLDSLYQAYGALADTKGLAMRLACDADVPAIVIGDSVRLRQILSNYLTNALKFTQAGEVVLAVQRIGGNALRFEVRDTGSGIAPASQAQLFTPFTQVDNSVNRRFGGTGLGLSICRQLAHLMEGEVGMLSEPGRGSVFWAELPLPSGSSEDLEASTGSGGMDPVNGARVLMVEDNPVNMMISVALLEQWGALVTQAHDGAQAIEAVEQAFALGRPYDVVLMDVQMPGISGHEATQVLRRRHSREQLPIIALTAAALVSERNQALAEGMNDFLTKPIDAQRLRASLVRALRALHGDS